MNPPHTFTMCSLVALLCCRVMVTLMIWFYLNERKTQCDHYSYEAISHVHIHLVLFVSDKKNGALALICELMDMNLYEMIRGMRLSKLCSLHSL